MVIECVIIHPLSQPHFIKECTEQPCICAILKPINIFRNPEWLTSDHCSYFAIYTWIKIVWLWLLALTSFQIHLYYFYGLTNTVKFLWAAQTKKGTACKLMKLHETVCVHYFFAGSIDNQCRPCQFQLCVPCTRGCVKWYYGGDVRPPAESRKPPPTSRGSFIS